MTSAGDPQQGQRLRRPQPAFLLTLISGEATRELAYGPAANGEIMLVESSEWDGPVQEPVERARFEVLTGPRKGVGVTIPGSEYLLLEEAEVVEGVFGAISRGTPAAVAVDTALLVARAVH